MIGPVFLSELDLFQIGCEKVLLDARRRILFFTPICFFFPLSIDCSYRSSFSLLWSQVLFSIDLLLLMEKFFFPDQIPMAIA